MMWYHGTDSESKENILEVGFIPSYGRFGEGIYFTNDKTEAEYFGEVVITINIVDSNNITNIYYPDLAEIYPGLSIDEEEGVTDLERYIAKELNKKAVMLTYVSGERELCVYDSSIINII